MNETVNKVADMPLPTWLVVLGVILILYVGQVLLLSKTLKLPAGGIQCFGFVLFIAFIGGFAVSEIQGGVPTLLPRAISYGLLATVPVGIISTIVALVNSDPKSR
jgi:hypothetical protein